jgi:Na+/H+ antiporter NhaA
MVSAKTSLFHPSFVIPCQLRFEYLTTQITFLQGLLNWLGAVTVDLILPKPKETTSAKRLNKALAAWLISFTLWMLAFYNSHVNFYSDYASMLMRFFVLFWRRYIADKPIGPMAFLYVPSFVVSSILTWRAFATPPEADDDDDNNEGDIVTALDRSI